MSPVLPADSARYVKSLLASPPSSTTAAIDTIHSTLALNKHPEGGYFVETDRDSYTVPNKFRGSKIWPNASARPVDSKGDTDESATRNASTTINYFLDPKSPVGIFHRNKGRTVHTLHSGRGIYVLIHADQASSNGGKAPVEVFHVGHDIARGQKIQWIVEGGKFKASFLLPDEGRSDSAQGLLISETVVPGFEFCDHDFLTRKGLEELLSPEQADELEWLLKKSEREQQ